MNRANARRRLVLRWWAWLVLCLAPLLSAGWFLGDAQWLPAVLAMPLFIVSLISLFVTLRLFQPYKHALIRAGAARNSDAEPAAWIELARAQRVGFIGAGLPVWIAVLGLFAGLEAVPLLLLAVASVTLMWLYYPPRQLA